MENMRLNSTLPNETDRISQLPQHIIERILFFLPAKDAARTSILSKTWLQVWNSLPIFSFHSDALTQPLFEGSGSFKVKVDNYMDVVDKSLEKLRNFKVLIKRFKLNTFVFHQRQASRINQFIELATRNYVNELVLHGMFCYPTGPSEHSLPSATFVSNSFSVLDISACVLAPTLFGDNPKFPCLRKLSFTKVYMDEGMVQSLLANCPLLETFDIDVLGVEHVVLRDLPKLKEVNVVGVRIIVIEAINIQKLHCEYTDENIELRLTSCDNLKELSLCAIFTAEYIQELVADLPSLETLFLEPHIHLKRLEISSQQLRHLILQITAATFAPEEVEIDAPNLGFYDFYLFNIISAEAASVSINTLNPLKAILNVGPRAYIKRLSTDQFFIGLNNYLQLFKYDVLNINLFFDMNESLLAQVRQASAAPAAYLEHLSLESNQSSFDFAAFLDCFFWICRPKMISIMPERVCSTKLIEKLSPDKMISGEKSPKCCSNCSRKCWRHYLEDIKVKKIVGMNNQNVQNGHDIALKDSPQSAEICKKLVLELTWKNLGQKRQRKERIGGC